MTSSDDDAIVTKQPDVLSADELALAYKRWEAPRMVSVSDVDGADALLSLESLETLQKEAQEEGYKNGFEQGYEAGTKQGIEAGQHEVNQRVAILEQLLANLSQPLQQLDQQLEQDLVNLVITVSRQLIRRELKIEPEHVIGAMRAALAALPVTERKLKIYLHPQDIELVQQGLAMDHDDGKWQWIEDPVMTRGGVRIETADTVVDATVEARLNSLINKLLGEERTDGAE